MVVSSSRLDEKDLLGPFLNWVAVSYLKKGWEGKNFGRKMRPMTAGGDVPLPIV
jgi:hypothetical protein